MCSGLEGNRATSLRASPRGDAPVILALFVLLHVPRCEFGIGDGTFLPSPCRYELPGGETLIVRRLAR